MTELSSNLGDALRARRRASGSTQVDLARAARVSPQTICLAERGKGRIATFCRLIDTLDLLIDGRNLAATGCLGSRLRALRDRRAMSRREAARALTISPDTLAAMERGGPGRVETLTRYGALLGAGLYLREKSEPRPFYTHSGGSSIHHAWQTPEALLNLLYRAVGEDGREGEAFDLDPCSPCSTRGHRSSAHLAPVLARVHFDIEDDGLSLAWFGRCFVNPPYGAALPDWVRKARSEVEVGRAELVIALVPARPDTRWWHENVIGHASVFMLRGRLKFRGTANAAPFPSALIVWGGTDEHLYRLRHLLPTAWFVPAAPALTAAD